MTPDFVLAEIRAHGGRAVVEGDGLRVTPKSCLTGDLRAAITETKVALIEILRCETSDRWLINEGCGSGCLVATVPAVTLGEMLMRYPHASIRALSQQAWELFDE
jgi:hypothetical protein